MILKSLPIISLSFTFLLTQLQVASAVTLKEMYDLAPAQEGYDRYLELETGVTYTGGLLIGQVLDPLTHDLDGAPGNDVRIVGNGAVLDLQGEQLCISYCEGRLDIDDCVILNGNIRFRGINTFDHQAMPTGSVRQVTFYRPHDYGIRLQGAGEDVILEWNLVVDVVETGWDWIYHTGIASEWLPTGASISPSCQVGFYGWPLIADNWTFHSVDSLNVYPLTHYMLLCEYG